MTKDFSYTTSGGHQTDITLYGADNFGDQPAVIYVHGFKGFKDWGFVPYAGEYFAQRGVSFITFNFSHNGIGKDPMNFTEFRLFEKNTFSLEVSEVLEIIHLTTHTNFFGKDLRFKPGIIGHSRGGAIALIAASQAPSVAAVATWSSVSTLDRYTKEDRQKWRKRGYQEVINSRTGQVFKMGIPILDDIEKYARTKLNVLQAVKNYKRPLLIIHGQDDETVPNYEAEHLNIYGDPANTSMSLIPGGSHTFGATHPFSETTPQLEMVLENSLGFFLRHIK